MKSKKEIKFILRDFPIFLSLIKIINRAFILPIYIPTRKILLKKRFKKSTFKSFKIKGNNFYLLLDPNNGEMDEQAFLNNIYEKNVTNVLLKNLEEKSVFIDIGANVGYFTNLAASICKNGKVFAFEPIKKIYQQNMKSIEKNKFTNIKLFNFALGSKNEISEIFINTNNVGGSSIIKDKFLLEGNNKDMYREKISIKKLDNILKDIRKIDLIKMDIEGFEYFAFIGMKNILKKFKPKIVFEYSPYRYESIEKGLSKKLLNFLYDLGYSIFDLDNKQEIKDIDNYLRNLEKIGNHSDLFCINKTEYKL